MGTLLETDRRPTKFYGQVPHAAHELEGTANEKSNTNTKKPGERFCAVVFTHKNALQEGRPSSAIKGLLETQQLARDALNFPSAPDAALLAKWGLEVSAAMEAVIGAGEKRRKKAQYRTV